MVRRVVDRASHPEKDRCAVEHVKALSQPVRGRKARHDLRHLNYYFVGNNLILIVPYIKRRCCSRLPFGLATKSPRDHDHVLQEGQQHTGKGEEKRGEVLPESGLVSSTKSI